MISLKKTIPHLRQSALSFLYMSLVLYLIFLLLCYPQLSLQYAYAGLTLWFQKMIPTLLPFMILSGILIAMNLTERFVRLFHPILHFFYGTTPNGSYILLMGFFCGFPMGARIAGELRKKDRISQKEAERLLAFCNNIGPVYFLSFVASTLSLDRPALPFLVMYGIPLCYGILIMRVIPVCLKTGSRYYQNRADEEKNPASSERLLSAIDSSIRSGLVGIGKLGGYMIFFNLLNILFVPFTKMPSFLLHLYQCILEITNGIAGCGNEYPYLVLIMLPFGGFSCIAQTYSMICDTDLSIRPYVIHKLIQTGLTALCYLLLRPFPL